MKTFLAAAAWVVTWLGASCAYAEPQSDSVRIKAPVPTSMVLGEFDDYASPYLLSNGTRITFSQRGQRFYAQLDGELKTEIVARGPGVYVTASGAQLEFSGKGEQLAIRHFERLASSGALPENTVMTAQR